MINKMCYIILANSIIDSDIALDLSSLHTTSSWKIIDIYFWKKNPTKNATVQQAAWVWIYPEHQ